MPVNHDGDGVTAEPGTQVPAEPVHQDTMQTDQDWINAGCPAAWCAVCGCGLVRTVFRHLPTCKDGIAMEMPQPEVRRLAGASVLAAARANLNHINRADKADAALVTLRATLAQHVEENLSLHRRVTELEESLQNLVTASEARVTDLEDQLRHAQGMLRAYEMIEQEPKGV